MEEQDMHEEEYTTDEIAEAADTKVEALIELLIEKGVITEEEFEKKYSDFFEPEEDDSSDDLEEQEEQE